MICSKCTQPKVAEDFYPSDHRWCKMCRYQYQKDNKHKYRDRDRKYFLEQYKANPEKFKQRARTQAAKLGERVDKLKDRPCMDCGVKYPPCVMDFDHVRGIKTIHVSRMRNRELSAVLEEIEKCDLVCANCHRIRTHERIIRSI